MDLFSDINSKPDYERESYFSVSFNSEKLDKVGLSLHDNDNDNDNNENDDIRPCPPSSSSGFGMEVK